MSFLYRLLFTRDDDLDLLQAMYLVLVVVTLRVVWRLTAPGTPDAVMIEGIVTLRWMVGLLVLTAVPKWLVPVMAGVLKSKYGESAGSAAAAAIAKNRDHENGIEAAP
jgi:hypothetical protein